MVVEDVVGNMLESLCNVFLIRGDDYSTLPKYHEAAQHRFEVLEEAGFDMTSPKFRDDCMNELKDRGQRSVNTHQAMQLWRDAPNDGTKEDDMLAGKKG